MKILLSSIFFISVVFSSSAQQNSVSGNNKINPEDLERLIGEWKGSLTYVDYNSGKPFTMDANVNIEKGKNEYQLILNNIYPNEPKANNKDKLNVSKDGQFINKKPIVSRKSLPSGELEVVVEYDGKDGNDNKAATIKEYYIISNTTFINRKEVKFEGEDKWFKRNEFSYSKD